ncbi:acyl-coenzyme A thioesterase 9, mitochondrial-like [Eurosta solidaginis]|uniref:acyl-coenzyme A thioesterase 9, mitochondrial-like n=1 Tax=Eurosta solidaginis TaxID=178769 RepID=UPI0035313BC3
MEEVEQCYMKRMGLVMGYNKGVESREDLLKYTPKLEDLPPRSMQDSFTAALIPLSANPRLQYRYVSHNGGLRMGRLIEDMDFFAVWVCLQHLHLPALPENVAVPYTFVTIMADKILIIEQKGDVTKDIRLSGHVSWVGRSSLEIVIWVEQMENNKIKPITRALFLMAARDAINSAAVPVNPISPATDEEKIILSGGEERKKKRLEVQSLSLFKVVPTAAEQMMIFEIHKRTKSKESIMLNTRKLPENGRWMSDWITISTIAPFPQNLNNHNTVFGGFLMRQMIQTAFTCANFYFADLPTMVCICDVNFAQPVPVQSFIKFTSYILYTEREYALLLTIADVLCAVKGIQITSNTLYIIFKASKPVHEIFPRTYDESLWYIQGTRIYRSAMDYIKSKNIRKS